MQKACADGVPEAGCAGRVGRDGCAWAKDVAPDRLVGRHRLTSSRTPTHNCADGGRGAPPGLSGRLGTPGVSGEPVEAAYGSDVSFDYSINVSRPPPPPPLPSTAFTIHPPSRRRFMVA